MRELTLCIHIACHLFEIYGSNIPSELKFQVSFKVPLWRGAFWSKGSLFFAYTQTSWFQQFNFRYSNPVRDSNYKPSIFYSYPADWDLFGGKGGKMKELRIGYLHFSNGIGGDECLRDSNRNPLTPEKCRSRSMGNRIMLELIWEKVMKNSTFGIHITAWPYIPKRKDTQILVSTWAMQTQDFITSIKSILLNCM